MKKLIAVMAVLVMAGVVSYAEDGIRTEADIDAVLQPDAVQPPVNQMIDLQNPANSAIIPAVDPAANPAMNPAINPAVELGVNPGMVPGDNPALNPALNPTTQDSVLSGNPALNPAGQGSVLSGNPAANPGVGPNSKDIGTWTNPADKVITNHGMSKKRANQQKHEDNLDQ